MKLSVLSIFQSKKTLYVLSAALIVLYTGWISYVIIADRPLDFYVYYLAAEEFARGGNAYTITNPAWDSLAAELDITNYTRPYRYPPVTAAIVALLRPLGPKGAAAIWVIFSGAAMIGGAWVLGGLFDEKYGRGVSMLLLLGLVPPLATLLAGQVNGFLYLCLALGLVYLQQRKTHLAAFFLALGAVLKVIPLALIGWLAWRRQWRAALISTLLVAALMLGSALLVGWQGLADYAQHALFLSRPDILFAGGANQTISGFLGRAFPNIDPALILPVSRWLALAIIGITVLVCRPTGRFRQLFVSEYVLIVCALQLIPPFTWYHQLVLLHIPLTVLAMQSIREKRWTLIAFFAVLLALSNLHGLFWHQIEARFGNGMLLSLPFLLGLSLWVYFVWKISRNKFSSNRVADG